MANMDDELKSLAAEMALDQMKQGKPQFQAAVRVAAEFLKIHYNALTDQGFTPNQALQIVIAHGLHPGGEK